MAHSSNVHGAHNERPSDASNPVADAMTRDGQTEDQLAKSLAESEARYQHLVENATDGIYRVDLQGYFIYANPVVSRVLAGGAPIVGRQYLEFVHADLYEAIQRFYYRQISDRTPVTYYEFPAITADGNELWIGQRVQTELDDHGNVVGLHAVARDITERKRLEEELRQSDKMRVVGQLAGGIAHDFNSILTAISGFSDLLIASLGPADERTRDAIEIRKAADKAARLTSQLLTFSRRDVFQPRRININAVIEDLRPMLTQLLGAAVSLDVQLSRTLQDVHADPGQMEQVLLNLALNAKDAMPTGGRFFILTENTSVGVGSPLAVKLYPGSYVVIRVTDTGIGMDSATRERIFEPFFTTKAPGEGTGLGLSTVYGIVLQAGGLVTVDSAPGDGTTFNIYLPQSRPGISVPTPERATPAPHGVVLLAEDEDGVRAVVTRVLEADGYRVIGATNGVDALEKARQHGGAIDLLLTDLVMPQMGGFELAQQFSAEQPKAHVLFMSGYVDETRVEPGMLRHVQLLHKPFDSETMLAVVRNAVPPRVTS